MYDVIQLWQNLVELVITFWVVADSLLGYNE